MNILGSYWSLAQSTYMLSEFVSFYFSALPKIIKAGFAALQLEYFFTAGPDEVRAWTIRVRFILIHQLYPVPHYWIQIDITDFEVCHGGG